MSFAVAVPLSGFAGFSFLNRTRQTQQDILVSQPRVARDIAAFKNAIGGIKSAGELVANRQLLSVALGAFGLDEDINNRFFIERILASDTSDPTSLASRFTDKRYETLAQAFGFGSPFGPRVQAPGFPDRIVGRYADRQFEIAVGEVDPDLRLALGFAREVEEIIMRPNLSNDAMWFTAMATPPVRKVLESSFGLPPQFGSIDLDQQLSVFKSKLRKSFGTDQLDELKDPAITDEITRTFLIRSQIQSGPDQATQSLGIALQLLR